jgi:uncharacterized protein
MFLSTKEMERGRVRFEQGLPAGEIEFEERLQQQSPLAVEGVAELVDPATGEIRLKGRFNVQLVAECDRCLEPAQVPVQGEFDLVYMPESVAPQEDDLEVDETGLGVGFYRGGGLDLAEVMREQVLLNLPMQRICDENCRGICPVCGQNRNQTPCSCEEKRVDDRWSALKDLT